MSKPLEFWPGQAEFLMSEAENRALFTGAGYGKSHAMGYLIPITVEKNTRWHLGPLAEAPNANHLSMSLIAPDSRFLTQRTIPATRGAIQVLEERSGVRLLANTGRNKNGYFSGGRPRIEFNNAIDLNCYPANDDLSGVAADLAASFVDEATFLKSRTIFNRLHQRVRDPRAIKRVKAYTGTPEAGHFMFDVVFEADGTPRSNWHVVTAASLENPYLPDQFFKDAETYGELYVRQQVFGEWVRGGSGERFAKVMDPEQVVLDMELDTKARWWRQQRFVLGFDPGYRTGAFLMFWIHPETQDIWLVDEWTAQSRTITEVCDEIIDSGYDRSNIRMIGCDIDAKKRRNGPVSEADIVRMKLGRTPQARGGRHTMNKDLWLRESYVYDLLRHGRLKISHKLVPNTGEVQCTYNALKRYSNRKMQGADGQFIDSVTPETERRWKHFIDAIHYAMIHEDSARYRELLKTGAIRHASPEQRSQIMGFY